MIVRMQRRNALISIKADMDNRANTIGADRKLCIASDVKLYIKALSELAEMQQSGIRRGFGNLQRADMAPPVCHFPYLNTGERVSRIAHFALNISNFQSLNPRILTSGVW